MNLKRFYHASKETYKLFLVSPIPNTVFPFFPSLRGRAQGTGPTDCNDTKSNGVAFTSKKMRLEQNGVDFFAMRIEKTLTNKYTPNLSVFALTFFFLPRSRGHA